MAQLFCIIQAENKDIRLYPFSGGSFMEQMPKFDDNYTLFQRTFLSAAAAVNDKNIISAVNVKYASNIKKQLEKLKEKFCRNIEYKIISEPVSKNTAPLTALAAKYINDNLIHYSNESPVILTAHSNRIFPDREILASALEQGVKLAENGFIVFFGSKVSKINPDMTYFKARKNAAVTEIAPCALKISEFIKNPAEKSAEELKKFKLYANTGIYMFSFDTYMQELKKNAEDIYSIIAGRTVTDSIPSISPAEYNKMPSVPLEDVIAADTKKLALMPVDMEFKTVNSWDDVYEASGKDENGNCFSGRTVSMECGNSLVYSKDKLTAVMGLKDMIVISSEDGSFICSRGKSGRIKEIYKKMTGRKAVLKDVNKTVYRPWGYYTVLESGEGFLTKCITVNPKSKLSLQRHFQRSEHWIILEGEAFVTKGQKSAVFKSGESVDIQAQEIHSLENKGLEPLKIIEVQMGDVLDENDIERLDDIYGRV